MTTQIEFRGNKKFDGIQRNSVNRGDVNRRITVVFIGVKHLLAAAKTRFYRKFQSFDSVATSIVTLQQVT